MVYDFKSEKLEKIATSTAELFKPEWRGENILEYNNPSDGGRMQKITN